MEQEEREADLEPAVYMMSWQKSSILFSSMREWPVSIDVPQLHLSLLSLSPSLSLPLNHSNVASVKYNTNQLSFSYQWCVCVCVLKVVGESRQSTALLPGSRSIVCEGKTQQEHWGKSLT